MPLFSNKFSPKKTPTRRAGVFLANKDLSPKRIEKELGPNVGPIRLKLGEQEAIFDAGLWIPGKILQCSFTVKGTFFRSFMRTARVIAESGKIGGTYKENEELKKEVKRLEEENNLLKLKFEVLLDMVGDLSFLA